MDQESSFVLTPRTVMGLAIVLLIYRNRKSVDLTGIDVLKG